MYKGSYVKLKGITKDELILKQNKKILEFNLRFISFIKYTLVLVGYINL